MNQITAFVEEIESVENLNIITLRTHQYLLKMLTLDLDQKIEKRSQVLLSCKPINVAIAKNLSGALSDSNQLPVTIISLESGSLLSVLELSCCDFSIESILTTASQKRMHLQVGDSVVALIKSSDLSIKRVL